MAKYTTADRQEIVEEFSIRHNGLFDAALFLAEVRAIGPNHRAHAWFEWDDSEAAHEHRLWQSRQFAHGLKVHFEVVTVGRAGPITVSVSAPMVISPMATRVVGGGYILTDPGNEEHMRELAHQAATALRAWLTRYGSTLPSNGISSTPFVNAINTLSRV